MREDNTLSKNDLGGGSKFVSNDKRFLNSFERLNEKTVFILFLSVWFIINILQAIFTEINPDEAYYALYAKNLAFGYFDHPPLIAVLIYLSSIFFKGNLGVRFFTVVLQIATLTITWLIVRKQDKSIKSVVHFFIISASLVMFSVFGFITTPDVPLLFFTSLFLYSYKLVLKQDSWLSYLFFSLTLTGLIYSKEHGILLIGFVVLSNLRLLINIKFWIAFLFSLILVSPYLSWIYTNGFPIFSYHLAGGSDNFEWKYFFEYFPNQLVVFNPITLVPVIYILVKLKPKNFFERAQYFIIIGFIGFFALSTLRGHVEPHWTVAASISMIILLMTASPQEFNIDRYINKYISLTLILILIARIILVTNLLPEKIGFFDRKPKYKAIEKIAGKKPVIFTGSFQNPSLYTFFTGNEATVVSSLYTRQTQFDIWQKELQYTNKPVFVCSHIDGKSTNYQIGNETVEGFFVDSLQTTNRLKIFIDNPPAKLNQNDLVSLNISVYNSTSQDFNFNHREFPVDLYVAFINGKEVYLQKVTFYPVINKIISHETKKLNVTFKAPVLKTGTYRFGMSLNSFLGPTLNSHLSKINLHN